MYGGKIVPRVKIVTWADGTDAEIAAMLNAHYAGQINIYDYWDVGDERTVHLSAMSATGVGESHVAQDVTMVLMNKGGKTLTGGGTCAFIVGMKNLLENNGQSEGGYYNSTATTAGGWNGCARRTWCNSVFKDAVPSTLVGIFKEHQNITADGTGASTATSNDYFALPAEKEIYGTNTYANSTAESSLSQFKYYETTSNQIKHVTGNPANSYFTRSPVSGTNGNVVVASFVDNTTTPLPLSRRVTNGYNFSVFGVI